MMTIYADLLDLALRDRDAADAESTDGDTLAELRECRQRLPLRTPPRPVLSTFTDQLAYDIALVRHAEHQGIGRDLSPFRQRLEGRSALERTVRARQRDDRDSGTLRSPRRRRGPP